MTKRRLLSIEDLVRFCQEQNVIRFSSKKAGYPLAVQVPATFEIDDNTDDSHRGMIRLKFRILHSGLNRNGSNVSKEAADEAALTLADRPILAHIHQLNDGSWDFEAHNMEIVENDDGEEEINYIEKQVGSFSSEPTFWEHDDELNKDYLCAYGYISEEYTKAADIIRAKGGATKNSCELSIENMTYNAKDKYLDLKKFYISASTLLGSYDDGTPIGEGMLGSRADMVEFSKEKNSVQFESNEDIKQFIQASIKEAIEDINNLRKEENLMDFEENAEVIETPAEETVEQTGETEEAVNETAEAETSTEENTVTEEQSEEIAEETPSEEEKFTKTFEISHEDIRYALYNLIAPFEEEDNEWYSISAVYDDYFIYEGMFNATNKFKQDYTKNENDVSLNGERIHVNVEYLSDSELAALNAMRSNYDEISQKLAKYEAEPKKLEILNSEDYALISDNEEFVALKEQDAHFDLSVEEVKNKANEILLNAAKSATFASNPKTNKITTIPVLNKTTGKTGRYGGLFNN